MNRFFSMRLKGSISIIGKPKNIIQPSLYLSPSPPPSRQVLTPDRLGVVILPPRRDIISLNPVNWVKLGAVTGHREQGNYMTCWAFAGSIAAAVNHWIHTQILLELSVQYVVDQTSARGERSEYLLRFIKIALSSGGLPLWQDYPYVLPRYPKGYKRAPKVSFGLIGFESLDPSDIPGLIKAVIEQPIVVGFPVSVELYEYSDPNEIITTFTCPSIFERGLHATVIVGYERSPDGQDYFIHKNTWDEGGGLVKIAIELEIYVQAYRPLYDKATSVYFGGP